MQTGKSTWTFESNAVRKSTWKDVAWTFQSIKSREVARRHKYHQSWPWDLTMDTRYKQKLGRSITATRPQSPQSFGDSTTHRNGLWKLRTVSEDEDYLLTYLHTWWHSGFCFSKADTHKKPNRKRRSEGSKELKFTLLPITLKKDFFSWFIQRKIWFVFLICLLLTMANFVTKFTS